MSDSGLEATPLGDTVYRRLRADIINCRIAPGEWLTERGVAAEMGFGTSPVRDALKRLDHDGLVRTVPRKGCQVKPLTVQSVDDLFGFWAAVGPEVARYGVVRATDEQLGRVIAGFEETVRLVEKYGATREVTWRTVEIVDEVFATLAEATGNDYMISAHHRVSGELARVWVLVTDSRLLDPGDMSVSEGGSWKEDFCRRDADAGAEHVRYFIRRAQDLVLYALARWPSVITSEVVPLRKTIS